MNNNYVKCPNCGSAINLDDREAMNASSRCSHDTETEMSASEVRIDESGSMSNYLELARTACEMGDVQDIAYYVRKVMEIDPGNADAWELKMYTSDVIKDVMAAGRKAMVCDTSEERKHSVYRLCLSLCIYYLMTEAGTIYYIENKIPEYSKMDVSSCMSAYGVLHEILEQLEAVDEYDYYSDMEESFERIKEVLKFRFAVPDEYISADEELSDMVVCIAKIFIDCQRTYFKWPYNENYNVFGISYWKRTLAKIKSGLPDRYLMDSISESRFEPIIRQEKAESQSVAEPEESVGSSEGCYIATAVYGSYDAPEVMALRDFRDNVLAKSCFGRAFIRTYYRLSPPLAERLKDAGRINSCVRHVLDKWIARLNNKR